MIFAGLKRVLFRRLQRICSAHQAQTCLCRWHNVSVKLLVDVKSNDTLINIFWETLRVCSAVLTSLRYFWDVALDIPARRYKKQIFLSVDVPPSFMTLGDGPKLTLAIEKAVVQSLDELDGRA